MRLVFCAVVVGVLISACQKSERALPGEQNAAAASNSAQLARYAALSPPARQQALRTMVLVGPRARISDVEALLQSAKSGPERAALQQAARPLFAAQYEKLLAEKGKAGKASARSKAKTFLFVKTEHCNRFLLEGFVGGDEGKMAKLLGFVNVGCSSQALELTAAL